MTLAKAWRPLQSDLRLANDRSAVDSWQKTEYKTAARRRASASLLRLGKTKRLVPADHHTGTTRGLDRFQFSDLLVRQSVHEHPRSLLYQAIGDADVLIWRYANPFHGDRLWISCSSHFASTGDWGRGRAVATSQPQKTESAAVVQRYRDRRAALAG